MKKTFLFAVDPNTEETIVSESPKGSNKVNFIARIHRNENELLFDSAVILAKITKSPNFELSVFKAMDKVCQIIYEKHIENT